MQLVTQRAMCLYYILHAASDSEGYVSDAEEYTVSGESSPKPPHQVHCISLATYMYTCVVNNVSERTYYICTLSIGL